VGARELISVDEARERVLAAVRPLPAEDVALDRALGRVLAADAAAAEDLPPFDASAMDGFAVPAGEAGVLTVVAESRAGAPATIPLRRGEAIRISTGAVVPEGTHAVVPVEQTEPGGGASPERVRVPATEAGANVRRAGEDVRAGEVVLRAGAELGPAEVAVLASLGLPRVACATRPRVAVLATGDELVAPGAELEPGQIRDSNAYAIAAQAQRAGAELVERSHVRDHAEATRAALAAALESADVVCVTGGVSVGPHDHVKPALAELGVEERFWGVRLQPGKPTWFGERDGRLVFGLPGNPVSAMVTFQLFALPALRALQGAAAAPRRATALLAEPIRRNPKRDQMVRVRLETRGGGWRASRTKEQYSHVLTSMLGADALARIPAGDGDIAAGEQVDIELL
jgi:molybdopterin molybdotransferase